MAYLDNTGLQYLINQIKNKFALKTSIPTVNNATITIKQGSSSQTFTTNQSSAKTITLTDNNTWGVSRGTSDPSTSTSGYIYVKQKSSGVADSVWINV